MKAVLPALLALGLSISSGVSAAECRKVVFSANPDYPPFHWADRGKLLGASIELTERIFKELGVEAEPRYVGPWNRVLKAAELGQIDLVVALKITPERQAYLDFTPARFSANPMAVFVRADRRFDYHDWPDLRDKRGEVARGDRFGDGFDQYLHDKLDTVEADSMAHGFADLEHRRVDYFITGFQAGSAYLAGLGLDTRMLPLQPMINQGAVHHAFSKLSPCLGLLDKVSERLSKYDQDGTTGKLLTQYLERWRQTAASRVE